MLKIKKIINCLTFILLFLLASNLYAKDFKRDIQLTAYIKGIKLANGSGYIVINNNNFSFNISAETVGIFSIISNWKQTIKTEGKFRKSTIRSITYKSDDHRGNKSGHMYLLYKKTYPEIISAQPDPRKDDRREKIDNKLLEGTFDPIAGILNFGIQGKCGKKIEVFDGKRKYALYSKYLKKETIKKNKFFSNSFETIKCVFDIEKLGGYTDKEKKKYPKNGFIWFKEEAENFYLPAKIEINSSWGSFICLIKKKEFNNESNYL